MLSPREVAAERFAATRSMPRRVLGLAAYEVAELRAARTVALRRALAACQAAVGSERIVCREWTDENLTAAAAVLRSDLEAFA